MRKILILTFFLCYFFSFIPSSVLASQAMPKYGINEKTKECSEFFMGDECSSCALPDDWQVIEEFQCPAGYKVIRKNSKCTPIKNSFCCTIQHSGTSGDCDDIVVNDIEQKCAFVSDFNKCDILPANWHKAKEIYYWGKVCPSLKYTWLEKNLNCEKQASDTNFIDLQKEAVTNIQSITKSLPLLPVIFAAIILLVIFFLF